MPKALWLRQPIDQRASTATARRWMSYAQAVVSWSSSARSKALLAINLKTVNALRFGVVFSADGGRQD
jgi:hypothetical protein